MKVCSAFVCSICQHANSMLSRNNMFQFWCSKGIEIEIVYVTGIVLFAEMFRARRGFTSGIILQLPGDVIVKPLLTDRSRTHQ